ncbi:hypothetical protein [Streptomyces huiliensis]|uniref:hypothetical protein n=1 Tax=Streptomyces huiliensis TaxID=2876027 RepID=UPI001CBD429F|nr:hypothetical protein [Streptomyces huiliensis]MBZ4324516.1 hypothetical protein [Streptomyces huiliensis]
MPYAKAGNQTYFIPQGVADTLGYKDPHGGVSGEQGSDVVEAIKLFNAIAKSLGTEQVPMLNLANIIKMTDT